MRSKLFALAGLGILSSFASAAVTFDFSIVYTGADPGGDAPWATLVIENSGVDEVTLTLTHNSTSAADQFLTELNLNIDNLPGDLAESNVDSKITGIDWGLDAFNDAGQQFDLRVNFETSNSGGGVNRVKPGDSVSFTLSGSGLDELDFDVFSVPSGDGEPVKGLVHIQGIEGEFSSKVAPVPEPASMAALGLGALALIRRRRNK